MVELLSFELVDYFFVNNDSKHTLKEICVGSRYLAVRRALGSTEKSGRDF